MSVYEISEWQQQIRQPFDSVGMVCKCGHAVAGMEGVIMQCASCGTAYIVSVMVLRKAEKARTKRPEPAVTKEDIDILNRGAEL